MSELNRRDVIRAVAAGTAVAGTAMAATSGRPAAVVPTAAELRRAHRLAATRVALQRAVPGETCGLSPVQSSIVAGCRSFDGQVLLELDDGRTGLVALDPRGFAVAAAAQAAGRPLCVRTWGHEPEAEAGIGRFAGALLAFAAEDLGAGAQFAGGEVRS